jgi:hypothetical protein
VWLGRSVSALEPPKPWLSSDRHCELDPIVFRLLVRGCGACPEEEMEESGDHGVGRCWSGKEKGSTMHGLRVHCDLQIRTVD